MADDSAGLVSGTEEEEVKVSLDSLPTIITMRRREWEKVVHVLELYPNRFPNGLKFPSGHTRRPPTGEVGWIYNGDPTILVLGLDAQSCCDNDAPRLLKFHKVDLKQCKLEENCYPSLFTRVEECGMFGGSSKICMIGSPPREPSEENYGTPRKDVYWYRGASVLDTSTKTWKGIALPVKNHVGFSSCVSLDNGNKLYHFGGWPFINPEAYNPTSNSWEDLTPLFKEFAKCHMNGAVISDSINKRILFNIFGGNLFTWGHLYAYYPDCEKKIQLVSVCVPWSYIVAVAKDVAYVRQSHRPAEHVCDILHAYDLSTWISKPLDVVWTSTVLKDADDKDVLLESCCCSDLFYVGSDIFWMAFWFRTYLPPRKTSLYFLKFTATREEDKITCTPLNLQCHELKSGPFIHGFLMSHPE